MAVVTMLQLIFSQHFLGQFVASTYGRGDLLWMVLDLRIATQASLVNPERRCQYWSGGGGATEGLWGVT